MALVAAAGIVWGSDLLRFGSDSVEELGFVLRAGEAGAGLSRCADADVTDPDVGLSGASL